MWGRGMFLAWLALSLSGVAEEAWRLRSDCEKMEFRPRRDMRFNRRFRSLIL